MFIEEKRYEINEVFNMIGEDFLTQNDDSNKNHRDMIIDGFNVRPKSLRYMTFYQKGCKCAICGKEGTHFKLCGDPNTNRRHFNLYAEDGTLMTKDHIIPASKGGQDKVQNMQTMCCSCNVAKGNDYDNIQIEYVVGRKVKNGKEITFRSVETAANFLTNTYGKVISKKMDIKAAIKTGIATTLKLIAALENGTDYCGYTWTKEMR